MQARRIEDESAAYIRITKREAFIRFARGEMTVACPVNLRPGFPWAPHVVFWRQTDPQTGAEPAETFAKQFERFVRNCTVYNCTDTETGRYLAFYRTVNK